MKKFLNKIQNIDVIEGFKKIDDSSIDLIIADPPYNLNKDFGIWKENEKKSEWLDWSKSWIDECKRVLKDDGNLLIYGIHHYLCFLQVYLYEIKMVYRRQIIWKYENGFSGYTKSLSAFYEPLIWFSKSKKLKFKLIREPYKSKERLKNKIIKNGKVWTPNPEGRIAGDIWEFPTLAGKRFEDEKVNHPTQKPLSISNRIVNHFSNEQDTVLIPFSGSGTECVSCKNLNRNFIAFEINSEYIQIANERLITLQQ